MKKTLILSIILIYSYSVRSQCNVQTTERSDGITIRYLRPELVGKGTKCELGLSIQHNGELYTINTVVRYLNTAAKKVKGDLKIKLANNISIEPKLFRTELATQNNEQLGLGVYILTDTDVQKLKKSLIKIVVFQEVDGINQIVIPNTNTDVAQRHIKCLEQ